MLSREIWVQYQSFENVQQAFDNDDWLSTGERAESQRYRDENRLRQWKAGRWLAKRLLAEQLLPSSTDWSAIEIRSRDEQGRAVRPEVRVAGERKLWGVSISHSKRGVLVGVSLSRSIQVGVDLAEKEDLNPHSLVFWFTNRERDLLRKAGPRRSAVCWAVKEAVYKAVNTGESFVPKNFEVFPRDRDVYECHHTESRLEDRSRIHVWDIDDHVAVTAIVARSPAELMRVARNHSQETSLATVKQEAILVGTT